MNGNDSKHMNHMSVNKTRLHNLHVDNGPQHIIRMNNHSNVTMNNKFNVLSKVMDNGPRHHRYYYINQHNKFYYYSITYRNLKLNC